MTLFLHDKYAMFIREPTIRMMELHTNWGVSKSITIQRNLVDTYNMRLIIVVLRNFGPSLVGKLQVLKIPP